MKTSWPALTGDLLAGRFDLAMGGVRRGKGRAESGSLSVTYLTDRKVALVPDNLAIPGMIAEGRGDAMFTDGAEAKVHARRDPRLCVALADPPLARVEKVYYLPKGQAGLLRAVNAWVGKMRAGGSYARLWARYVGA